MSALHRSRRSRLGTCLPRPRFAGDGRRLPRRALASRQYAVPDDGGVFHRRLPDARHVVLALYDPLRDHRQQRCSAGQVAILSVLGRRAVRAAGDRDLHRRRLLGVPRQVASGIRGGKPADGAASRRLK